MKEVWPGLYVGDQNDFESVVKFLPSFLEGKFAVIHACKEPYHRQLLGYKGRGASKDHPEYLVARRGNRLYLNLIDGDNPDFVPNSAIEAALSFIDESLKKGNKVLVHCNQGESRSPY